MPEEEKQPTEMEVDAPSEKEAPQTESVELTKQIPKDETMQITEGDGKVNEAPKVIATEEAAEKGPEPMDVSSSGDAKAPITDLIPDEIKMDSAASGKKEEIPEKKDPVHEVPEIKEKKDPVDKVPENKDPVIAVSENKDPVDKIPENKDPVDKIPENKGPVIAVPEKKDAQKPEIEQDKEGKGEIMEKEITIQKDPEKSDESKKAENVEKEDEEGDEESESDDSQEDEEDGEEEEEEDEEDDDEGEEEDAEEKEDAEDEEPPQQPIKMVIKTPPATTKKVRVEVMKVSTPGSQLKAAVPFSEGSAYKKRGRPSRLDMEVREKERQAAIARGEPDPELKRRRRKPAKLKDGASEQEDSAAEEPKGKKRHRRTKEEIEKAKEAMAEEKKKGKKGRKKLTEEELEQREIERKKKYQEARALLKAKKEKREAYLARKRDEKKKQRELEKKAREDMEKRMAELRAQYLDDNATDGSGGPGTPAEIFFDENSQSSIGSLSLINSVKKKKTWGDVSMTEMIGIHNPLAHVTAETLFEYKWPLDGRNSEHYFLQEQVTEYLDVKSFKRKYPDCPRRTVEIQERDFLIEMKICAETQADLGLTAIPSSAVLDIMCQDFYDKYEAYMTVLNERKERSLRNVNYSTGGGDVKVEEAAKIAAEYNKKLNQDRREGRKAFFDMQTFRVHYPKNNKGKMKVVQKPKLGNFPVALIPGQFVDYYKSYSNKELKFFPLNTVTVPPPKSGVTLRDMDLGSEGSESDSCSSSSGSSCDSDSDTDDEDEENEEGEEKKDKAEVKDEVKKEGEGEKSALAAPGSGTVAAAPGAPTAAPGAPAAAPGAPAAAPGDPATAPKEEKPDFKVDEVRPHAICKMCEGNMNRNKIGIPEMMLNCTKCHQACHPTCAELHLDLIQHVTGYQWECTDCKMCLKCKDPADEDKMLFCDLCDRGYHIYCVGLKAVPTGRWHCGHCASCVSCGTTTPAEEGKEDGKWIHEMKVNMKGEKVFSHTMCQPCHKSWKKGNYCPECNGVFDISNKPTSDCWVCARTHHISCVGLSKAGARFICSACQRKVQERTRGSNSGGGKLETPRQDRFSQYSSRTPTTSSFSRSGRRVTQINFANQF